MSIRIHASAEFRYAMVNRPPGYSHCPKEGFLRGEPRPASGKDHHDAARNGVAVYDRQLTDHETNSFEMAPMLDGAEREAVAHEVIKGLGEYAPKYKEIMDKQWREVRNAVERELEDVSKGYTPSVGDMDKFAKQVMELVK